MYDFYQLRKAHEKKDVDEDYKLHRLAFHMQRVKATEDVPGTGKGKHEVPDQRPIYPDLDSFYPYEDIMDSVDKGVPYQPKQQQKQEKKKTSMSNIAEKLAERNKQQA